MLNKDIITCVQFQSEACEDCLQQPNIICFGTYPTVFKSQLIIDDGIKILKSSDILIERSNPNIDISNSLSLNNLHIINYLQY